MRVPGPPNSPLSRRAAPSRAVLLLNPTKKQPLRSVPAHAVQEIKVNPTLLRLDRSRTRTRTTVLAGVVPRRLHPRVHSSKRIVPATAATSRVFPRKVLRALGIPINAAQLSRKSHLLPRMNGWLKLQRAAAQSPAATKR